MIKTFWTIETLKLCKNGRLAVHFGALQAQTAAQTRLKMTEPLDFLSWRQTLGLFV